MIGFLSDTAIFIILLLIPCSVSFEKSIISTINTNPNSTWVAEANKFTSMSLAELRSMFNQDIVADLIKAGQKRREGEGEEEDEQEDEEQEKAEALAGAKEFDARTAWPDAIHPIRNQQKCGSCWAFAGTEVLSDRFAIAGQSKGVLSPQDLVSCDLLDHGCNGGSPLLEWTWMALRGVATEECIPYVSGNGSVPRCPRKCANGSVIHRVKAKHFTLLPSIIIQADLKNNGPQEFCMMVYEDFMAYKAGVYTHQTGALLGGHAVKSIGWGEDENGKFWIVANSWGTDWGEQGFFRIKRGTNECSIESMVFAGTPNIDS